MRCLHKRDETQWDSTEAVTSGREVGSQRSEGAAVEQPWSPTVEIADRLRVSNEVNAVVEQLYSEGRAKAASTLSAPTHQPWGASEWHALLFLVA